MSEKPWCKLYLTIPCDSLSAALDVLKKITRINEGVPAIPENAIEEVRILKEVN